MPPLSLSHSMSIERNSAMVDLPIDLPNLSVNQIFRRLPRERLQLHPLLWTPRHLDLLRCAFVDISGSPSPRDIVEPSSAPGPAPERRPLGDIGVNTNAVSQTPGKRLAVAQQPPGETGIHRSILTAPDCNRYLILARTLYRSHVVAAKEAAVAALLSENFVKTKLRLVATPSSPCRAIVPGDKRLTCRSKSKCCTLHFETLNVPLPCLVLVSPANAAQRESPDAVRIAYLDASKIQSAREKYLKSVCWATSDATHAIYTTRLARLTPEPGANDPYILAVLIALAQRRPLSKSAAATTPSSKVRNHYLVNAVRLRWPVERSS